MKVYPPTIHMNGTPAKTFVDGYQKLSQHLMAAHEQLMALRPHMRDYYVQEDGETGHRMALLRHATQAHRLEKSIDEVEALRFAILDQVKS